MIFANERIRGISFHIAKDDEVGMATSRKVEQRVCSARYGVRNSFLTAERVRKRPRGGSASEPRRCVTKQEPVVFPYEWIHRIALGIAVNDEVWATVTREIQKDVSVCGKCVGFGVAPA